MTRFEPGDLAHAPFHHVERAVVVRRPVLILAVIETDAVGTLLWTAMITNAARPAWVGDVTIPDATARGLVIPSKVRTAKLATIAGDDAVKVGVLHPASLRAVRTFLTGVLAIG